VRVYVQRRSEKLVSVHLLKMNRHQLRTIPFYGEIFFGAVRQIADFVALPYGSREPSEFRSTA